MITFSDRISTAFRSKKKPDSFDDLLDEIITVCEPLAAPMFAKLSASKGFYIGPKSIADGVSYLVGDLWSGDHELRSAARQYVTGLAAVADGNDSFGEGGK